MDHAALEKWLEAYGRAWETRDPEAVTQLFTPDALYRERPFTEPLHGREAIRDYWSRVVVRLQDQIQFGFEIVTLVGSLGIARWWASFTRISSQQRVQLDGIFLLTFSRENLCCELREWWHRQENASSP